MRLQGRVKAGFYPTPREVVEGVLQALSPGREALEGKVLLDPCAGEGEAAAVLAEGLGMVPWGVELDEGRARQAALRFLPLGGKVLQGDALDYEARGFALVWLNPPYDWDEEGERLEEIFFRTFVPSVLEGGILFLVAPERELLRLWPEIRLLGKAVLFRFPEKTRRFGEALAAVVRDWGISPADPEPLSFEEGLKALQKLTVEVCPAEAKPILRPKRREEELAQSCRTSPLWSQIEGGLAGRETRFTPLLPLRKAHLALLLAGGLMDLQTLEVEGKPYTVLGRLRKETVVHEEEDGEGRKRVEREVFRAGLVLLNMETGEVKELE
ncbi:MAG: DUF6094 domain-containing protein [Thermus sp.]